MMVSADDANHVIKIYQVKCRPISKSSFLVRHSLVILHSTNIVEQEARTLVDTQAHISSQLA